MATATTDRQGHGQGRRQDRIITLPLEDSRPQDLLKNATSSQFEQLTASERDALRTSLTWLREHWGVLRVGAFFHGCEVCSSVLEALGDLWRTRLGASLPMALQFVVEKD